MIMMLLLLLLLLLLLMRIEDNDPAELQDGNILSGDDNEHLSWTPQFLRFESLLVTEKPINSAPSYNVTIT